MIKPIHFGTIVMMTVLLSNESVASHPTGTITGGKRGAYDPAVPEELRVRNGLPNFFAKLNDGKKVRIAYLGGSITQAEGWRIKTLAWFQEQYPKAEPVEINAAISGTGADFAACRLSDDLLPHRPDLVFIEFRVNGGGGFEARAIEGLVRQIWKANPEIDICLVYTIGEWMINELQDGKQFWFGEIMETMANEYEIPSIDLGVEVVKQLDDETLVFKSNKPAEGKLWFSKDGVHPIDAGHELYKEIIARSMLTMKEHRSPAPHKLPQPIEHDHFANATLLPATAFKTSDGWQTVDTEIDEIYNRDKNRTQGMLRGAVKTSKTGETLEFYWEGQLICFTHIPQGKGIKVEISIDGGTPETYRLDQTSDKNTFARFQYAAEQKQGKHTAKLTVTKLPDGQTFYAGQILVIGEPE